MTLQTPNIDDRTFQQLRDELVKQIPGDAWSDHNPSDPGVMLLELLAWLGEMLLYRMNRVRPAHIDRFLKLILDPPDPVVAKITARLTPPRTNPDPDLSKLVLPPGLRFATDYNGGLRYVFETFQEQVLAGPPPGDPQEATFFVRSWKEVGNEVLGISNGLPNQEFVLREGPVLLDFVHESSAYRPNPEIRVGAIDWQLQQFLAIDGTTATSEVFTVDVFHNLIRFGDGVFGKIPPEGAEIVCKRYQVVEGTKALVKAGEIKHILDDVSALLAGTEVLGFDSSADAQGGMLVAPYRVTGDERTAAGLREFRRAYRLITPADFERVIMDDFNALQKATREAPFNRIDPLVFVPDSLVDISRTLAVMNQKPVDVLGVTTLVDAPAHVTLLVMPQFDIDKFNDPTELVIIKKNMVMPSLQLTDKIRDFVEQRRLITSQVDVVGVRLREIHIKADVRINSDESETVLADRITKALFSFVNILTGFHEGTGWPFGMNLYKAQVYRLIESIAGVSFVESLKIDAPSDPDSVAFSGPELPLLADVVLSVTRI